MPDGEDPDKALAVVELVDDSVGTDAERPQPPKTPSKGVACLGFAFEKAEGLDVSVGQRPVEIDDLLASASDELDPAHLRMSTTELSAQIVERHDLRTLSLPATFFDGGEGVGVGLDLSSFLQGLISGAARTRWRRGSIVSVPSTTTSSVPSKLTGYCLRHSSSRLRVSRTDHRLPAVPTAEPITCGTGPPVGGAGLAAVLLVVDLCRRPPCVETAYKEPFN